MASIQQLLKLGLSQLQSSSDTASLDAEVLLAFVLQKNRSYLYTYPEREPSPIEEQRFLQLIKDRAQGHPIAYLLGEREFWSMNLRVNQHTLIPRPETEHLVEITLSLLANRDQAAIADLGTGSGAIALALAKERPSWQIDAVDNSLEALAVASDNAQRHQLQHQVKLIHSHWFDSLPAKAYDALVSNPPYIAPRDPHLQQGDLRFEPPSALVAEEAGLADIRQLIEQGLDYLKPGGWLLIEHGWQQKADILAILINSGYTAIQSWQDWQGLDRISGGKKN